jgi:hypothetical protein
VPKNRNEIINVSDASNSNVPESVSDETGFAEAMSSSVFSKIDDCEKHV